MIGHRGASGHAPENTLASMRKAAELGVRRVEFDTRLSADGEIVVFHDNELKRTTNGSGLVSETPLEELQALDAGAWFSEAFAGEPIPTLGQMLDQLAKLGLGANVEIKSDSGGEDEAGRVVASFLKGRWPKGLPPPLISSFKPQILAAAANTAAEIPRALCIDEIPADWRQRLNDLGCGAIHCRHDKLTGQLARAVGDAGTILRCYTVNGCRRAEKLFGWGVEAVFSDYPERISQRLFQLPGSTATNDFVAK